MTSSAAAAQPESETEPETEPKFRWSEESLKKAQTEKRLNPMNCDRHRVLLWGNGLLVIVADGAGSTGAHAAEMACDLMPGALESAGARVGDVASITAAFATVDSVIKMWTGGLAAVAIAIIRPGCIVAAHAGDTMVYLVRKGCNMLVELTEHRHNTQTEHETHAALKRGAVRDGLFLFADAKAEVGTQLTRGLGGKKYGNLISAVPEVRHYDIHADDTLLIVASDGLDESIDFPYGRRLVEDIQDATPEAAMYRLMAQYAEKPPHDDVTAVVVDLAPFRL